MQKTVQKLCKISWKPCKTMQNHEAHIKSWKLYKKTAGPWGVPPRVPGPWVAPHTIFAWFSYNFDDFVMLSVWFWWFLSDFCMLWLTFFLYFPDDLLLLCFYDFPMIFDSPIFRPKQWMKLSGSLHHPVSARGGSASAPPEAAPYRHPSWRRAY